MRIGDETYEYSKGDNRRTIWYRFEDTDDSVQYIFSQLNEYGSRTVITTDYTRLIDTLIALMKADLQMPVETPPSETGWIFYTAILDSDAIEDKVRLSIYVRLKDGRYTCNINMSDFIFASSFDNVLAIKAQLEGCLNMVV